MERSDLPTLAADILKTMIVNGQVPAADMLPNLLEAVGAALSKLQRLDPMAPMVTQALSGQPPVFRTAVELGQQPAVPIRESVTPEAIFCLEDGKPMKMLRRHIWRLYGLTPEDYRRKWGLPPEYPLVAPNYAKQKSKYAKLAGLGTHRMRQESARKNAA